MTLDFPAPLVPTSVTRSLRRSAAASACSQPRVPVIVSNGTWVASNS